MVIIPETLSVKQKAWAQKHTNMHQQAWLVLPCLFTQDFCDKQADSSVPVQMQHLSVLSPTHSVYGDISSADRASYQVDKQDLYCTLKIYSVPF